MTFPLTDLRERIGLRSCPASLAGLRDLQAALMHAVAFENIDPLLGKVPDLAVHAICNKLIDSRRGGYCFELNGLLGAALQAMDFSPRAVLGRVRMGAPAGGPRLHLAWIVALEGREWLVDAGFGGPGAVGPLALMDGIQRDHSGKRFRLNADRSSGERVLEAETDGGWLSLYGFDDAVVTDADIEAANFYCARAGASPFPTNLMLNLHRADGRVSLFNRQLKLDANGRNETWLIESSDDFASALTGWFGLYCEPETVAAAWQRLSNSAEEKAA